MATVEMVDFHADDDFYHSDELKNRWYAEQLGVGIGGIGGHTIDLTITESDRVISYAAFIAVVPDGSGSFVLIAKAAGSVTASVPDPTDPFVGFAQLKSDGVVAVKEGTATAEVGDRGEAPMDTHMDDDAIMLFRYRRPAAQTNVLAADVKGRAIFTDIYRDRSIEAWVADDVQNPALGNLPANTIAEIPEKVVEEGFNSSGTDEIQVGYDADNDFLATLTDVTTTGAKSPAAGVGALVFNATARAIEAYYVNGGSEPTTGKALVTAHYRFVPPLVA